MITRVQLEVVGDAYFTPVVVQLHVLGDRHELVFEPVEVIHGRRDRFVVERLFFECFLEVRFAFLEFFKALVIAREFLEVGVAQRLDQLHRALAERLADGLFTSSGERAEF